MVSFKLPPKFLEMYNSKSLERFSLGGEENQKNLISWLKSPSGNLLFHGKMGRQKTFCAAQCVMDLIKTSKIQEHEFLFCNLADLYQFWLAGFIEKTSNLELLNRLKAAKLLVLDDLGVREPTDAFLKYLYCLINYRCDNHLLSTIYTTNLSSEEINKQLGSRIVSRISDGVIIEMKGKDKRKES